MSTELDKLDKAREALQVELWAIASGYVSGRLANAIEALVRAILTEQNANIEKGSGVGLAGSERKPVTDARQSPDSLGELSSAAMLKPGPVIPTPTACPHCGHRHPPDGVCI